MKKTLLIFFIILTTIAPQLAFSGSIGADSVTVKSNKATANSIAEKGIIALPSNAVLSKKPKSPLPDSTTISPIPNSQSLVTSHQ
jgi:hypothetical protein